MVAPLIARVAISSLAKAAKGLAKRKPVKKQSTPKSDMNRVMKQNDRQAAKEYKKQTGESIKSLTPGKGYQSKGAKQFKRDYKKPKYDVTRGMSESFEKSFRTAIKNIEKKSKPKDPYGAPMRKVDKRTADKYKELTPADYKRFANETLKSKKYK